jgi:cephalosporin-C deacetylase-like acetyl esterase
MKKVAQLSVILLALTCVLCQGQHASKPEASIPERILVNPTEAEIREVVRIQRAKDLRPKDVRLVDTVALSNGNKLFILSHQVGENVHYGAVILPSGHQASKHPIVILATGGDGMHGDFDIAQDFNHKASQFPNLLGAELDQSAIVVIPSFRGQTMILAGHRYQSEGKLSDAFDGATTDALALLNVVLESFDEADDKHISIIGGSRGGTVALLAAARDKRIGKVIAIAAPTDMI